MVPRAMLITVGSSVLGEKVRCGLRLKRRIVILKTKVNASKYARAVVTLPGTVNTSARGCSQRAG
jgi:hypothetical protein